MKWGTKGIAMYLNNVRNSFKAMYNRDQIS